MNNRRQKEIPSPVIRRVSKYLIHIERLEEKGRKWVSSKDLADALGLTRSTVRMDVSYLRVSGVSKRGYAVEKFRKTVAKFLGVHKGCKVIIVGAGNLGRALALHKAFAQKGFKIGGIFDSDSGLLNEKVGSLRIRSMDTLSQVVRRQKIRLAIIAVPAQAAQEVADKLVQAGVRGLLNLACADLIVPNSVAVIESRIAMDLRELCCAVRMRE